MASKAKTVPPPTGWRRHLFRAPVQLYRWHLGWVLGGRFCLLGHTGRISGQPRQVVLEVVDRDPATGQCLVASGFGPTSQWYRNICDSPRVTLQIGRRRTTATALALAPPESGQAMARYAQEHPRAARRLMDLCGITTDASPDDYYRVGHDFVPFAKIIPLAGAEDQARR